MFTKIKAVRVQEVILSGSASNIGAVRYNDLDSGKPMDTKNLKKAFPLFSNISSYPVVNEIVYLVAGPQQDYNFNGGIRHYYIPSINIHGAINHNALPNEFTTEEIENNTAVGLNSLFKENFSIKPLQPYDGDVKIEGRQGNSIRFGSTTSGSIPNDWSNEGEVGNPILIIRNGQSGSKQSVNKNYSNLS